MNAERAAMIEGRGRGNRRDRDDRRDRGRDDRRGRDNRRGRDDRRDRDGRDRDVVAPRRDERHRVGKPAPGPGRARPSPRPSGPPPSGAGMTDEERFVAESDMFVVKQTKKRAAIRVREGRGHPIDFLVFGMRFVDTDHDPFDDEPGDVAIDVPSPDAVLAGRSEGQLEELAGELDGLATLDANRANVGYWRALATLVRRVLQQRRDGTGTEADQILGSVAPEIDRLLRPKTLAQLDVLERQFKAKLRSDAVVDTDYWERLLQELSIYKARAVVAQVADAARDKRLALLADLEAKGVVPAGDPDDKDKDKNKDDADADTDRRMPLAAPTTTPGTQRFAEVPDGDDALVSNLQYEREAAQGIGENEELLAEEGTALAGAPVPGWAATIQPRKPRYFNRVQMGYEWNKYNQTHYDYDNPPPKVVQGYKFNIFYPDLLDKSKAPTYHITREGGRRRGESFAAAGEEDTCLIRFSAGPPYEDIAFRIVDREWDYSGRYERGFKSVFEKGILQLHFQFKKVYYRK